MTFDYWLGLNKIAQETGGTGAAVCIPDDEASATPAANGWDDWGSSPMQTIAYEDDDERGKVVHIEANSTTTTAQFIIGDYTDESRNDNDLTFGTDNPVISMWLCGDGSSYLNIAVLATTNLATRFLYLYAADGTDAKAAPLSTSYTFYIGSGYRAAQWQYLEVDLAARIDGLEPGETILHVDAIVPVVSQYLAIDDFKLADGMLNRSWAQVPGAALERVAPRPVPACGIRGRGVHLMSGH